MFTRWIAILALLLATIGSGSTVILYFDGRGNARALAHEAQERRDSIREATIDVLVARCSSENTLRKELSALVVNGRDNLKAYYRRGLITRMEYEETIADQNDALRRLEDKSCTQLVRNFNRTAGAR
jgi:hypothetical protein